MLFKEGSQFSAWPWTSEEGISFDRFSGQYAAIVRPGVDLPDSTGILTSFPFIAQDLVLFSERSEHEWRNYIEARIIDFETNEILVNKKITPTTTDFSDELIDTSAFKGRKVQLQIRQNPTVYGPAFFTLVDDILALNTDPSNLIYNGDFEKGTSEGFTTNGQKGGIASIVKEGTSFSTISGSKNVVIDLFNGQYAANIRSAAQATVDSIGIVTSDSFVAKDYITFTERSESIDVNIEVRVLDAANGAVLISQKINPTINEFSHEFIDTSLIKGKRIRVQFRQNTLQPPNGYYTLIDDIRAIDTTPQVQEYFGPPEEHSVLARNTDGTYTLTSKDGTKTNYNAQGLQTSIVDRNGNTWRFDYIDANQDGKAEELSKITNPVGGDYTLSYSNGKVASITDPAGRTTRIEIDSKGDLVKITNPDGTSKRFTYNEKHLLTEKINERGQSTQYQFDEFGRVAKAIGPARDMLDVNAFGNIIMRRVSDVHEISPVDTQGIINKIPAGSGTFENPAEPLRMEDENGVVTRSGISESTSTFKVSRFGAPTWIIDPLGRRTIIERNFLNYPIIITRYDGGQSELVYDLKNNLISILEKTINAKTLFTYEPKFNQITSITDPNGNKTAIEYDERGNPIKITDAIGNVTNITYNNRGQPVTIRDPLGNENKFSYNSSNGNLEIITDPLGNVTRLEYDRAGNVTVVTDAKGNKTIFEYDIMNRLKSITDPQGRKTIYEYDAAGNLIRVTDALGHVTNFEYNEVDLLSAVINPLGQRKKFMYDSRENLSLTVDSNGREIRMHYDAADQLKFKFLPGVEVVGYDYSLVGDLSRVQDADSALTFEYDQLSRLVSATFSDTRGLWQVIRYGYDLNSNRATMESAAGTTKYGWDELNRIASITSPINEAFGFGYDVLSRRSSMRYPNNMQTSYSFDSASQLTGITHENTWTRRILSSFGYSYDRVGLRDRMQDAILHADGTQDGGLHQYSYDRLYRLISAQHPLAQQAFNPNESFNYDFVGNRTQGPNGANIRYDNANRITSDDKFTYAFDANGNMVSKTDKATGAKTIYSYDVENQLIRIDFPDGKFAEYRYDGLGRRFEKNVNGVITRWVYDNEDIHLEYDGSNNMKAAYIHGIGIDEPLIMYRAGKSYYYHADGLGSIVQLTDAQGNVVKSYIYNSFGVMVKQTGTVENPYTYTGREFDQESGLYYYRLRYYDPVQGRFLQEDPIVLRGGANAYVYVGNYPLGRIDPFGFDWLDYLVSTSNFFAGLGDTFTFGGTRWVRQQMGTDDVVNKCSGFYVAGEWSGVGLQFTLGGAGTARAFGWTTKIMYHGPHHTFGKLGKLSHIQVVTHKIGKKGSDIIKRIPLPWR